MHDHGTHAIHSLDNTYHKPASWRRRLGIAILLASMFLLLPSPPAGSAPVPTPTASQNATTALSQNGTVAPTDKWDLEADRVVANYQTGMYEAFGNASLTQGTNYLTADFARYYQFSRWVFLKGNVRARWDEYELSASEAEFDLETKTGWLKDGVIFAAGPHIYIKGERITRLKGDSYSFKNAKITACDGDSPAWAIEVGEGDLTLEGYANLQDPKFLVKDFPTLWFPYAVVPVKTKRQSGLLIPKVGTSDRLGFYYSQPVYWAISDERDMTFTESYFTSRGFMQGLEYRSTTDAQSQALFKADYIYDSRIANDLGDVDSQFRDEGLIRPNHSRFWIRSKYDGYLIDPDWKVKLDIDYVSDNQFIREFDTQVMNYDRDKRIFLDRFGRGLDLKDSANRTSQVLLSKDGGTWAFNAGARYTENTTYLNDNEPESENPTVQYFPELSAYAYKQQLLDTPIEWEGDSTLAYLYRRHGTEGGRLELHPRVSLPFSTKYGTIIPNAGVHQTFYGITQYQDENADTTTNKTPTRTIPEVDVTAFTELNRIFSFDAPEHDANATASGGQSFWTAMKHSVQPRVRYSWRPFTDQADLPDFDETDRMQPENEIRYSLTNILNRKQKTIAMRTNANGEKEEFASVNYKDLFRLRLEQAYDLREASRTDELDKYERRPFTDLMAEMSVYLTDVFTLYSRSFYSPYENEITRHEHWLTAEYEEIGSLSFGFDFQNELDEYKRKQRQLEMLKLGAKVFLPRNFVIEGNYQRDFVENVDVEKSLTLSYLHQCFTIGLTAKRTDYDTQFAVQFELLGLDVP